MCVKNHYPILFNSHFPYKVHNTYIFTNYLLTILKVPALTSGGVRVMSEILIDALSHKIDKISIPKQTGIKSVQNLNDLCSQYTIIADPHCLVNTIYMVIHTCFTLGMEYGTERFTHFAS